jgi:aminomethyltransferase
VLKIRHSPVFVDDMNEEVSMKTPLHHEHVNLKAKMVDFHGWAMPVWYTGIKEEHMATRRKAGLFDVSHMGEIEVKGGKAVRYLDHLLTRDIAAMNQGQGLYTFLLNDGGGIIDDLFIYCMEPLKRYLLCVNSANKDKDYRWMLKQNTCGAIIEDLSDHYAMIALQGPASGQILMTCLAFNLEGLPFHTFAVLDTKAYGRLIISLTGYTGAGGVEIFLSPDKVTALWNAFLVAGAVPCGLGARDTLRLEMGYPLHGNDITESTTPLEAGLAFAVDLKKDDFIGRQALVDQQQKGFTRRLTGLIVLDRGIAREGCRCMKDGNQVGIVTSGSISPVSGSGIALGYIDKYIKEGDEIFIEVRGKNLKSRVKKPPFVSGVLKA